MDAQIEFDTPEHTDEDTSSEEITFDNQDDVRELILPDHYNKVTLFPPQLVNLVLGKTFNQPMILPSRLERLTLGPCYRQPIEHFPPGLKVLRLWRHQLKLYAKEGDAPPSGVLIECLD